ncbi:MAG: hypothetical protein RL685_5462 [Pseudomonadota bacterium]
MQVHAHGPAHYISLAIASLSHSYGAVQPALAAIWLSVVLGAALGVWQRFAPRVTEPIRTFAVVAAALVVSLSLLPHALECEGILGLLGAALGYAAIPALERLGMALFHRVDPRALRLELGYAGLLLHRFGDGVTMSVEGHGYGVLWALGAHEVPIVALVTLAFAQRGLGVALARATALGLSSSLGYFLVSALPAASWHALHGWADAGAAGVLLHIVAHEGLRLQAPAPSAEATSLQPRSLPQRLLDLGAGLLACALIATLGLDHDSGALQLLQHLLRLALQVSPWLCVGLLLRVALRRTQLVRGRRLEPLLRAVDPATLACSLALLGLSFAGAHALLSILPAAGFLGLRGMYERRAAVADVSPPEQTPLPSYGVALEQDVVQLIGWVLLGFLGAAYVQAYVAPLGLEGGSALVRLAWAAAIAGLARSSAPAAVPLAAALVAQGLPPGAALAGVVLGACAPLSFSAPLLSGRARGLVLPMRAARAVLLLLLAAASVLAALPGTALPSFGAPSTSLSGSALSWLSLAALLAFVVRRIWQTGVRTWLVTSLGTSLWPHGGPGHEHASPRHG